MFNPYGITIKTPDGEITLAAGDNITIWPQGGFVTISANIPTNTVINTVTPWQPPILADVQAPNNSVYYSTDASSLVYKDAGGVVNPLY